MPGVPTNVASLMAVLSLNTLPFEANAAKAAGMMSAGGMLAMGAAGLGVIMAGTGIIATKMAGDFQAGITSLQTGAGEYAKNIKLVSDGILQMSKDTGTSTKQLIDGMYMIESGGFHGAAGLAILRAAAEGAKVGSADLGTIADTTDTILKNFGEHGALSATQAVNALITTVANGKTHLEDLGNSLSGVLPAGAAAGLGLKDVLGAMAELTNVGIPAAEASTYLRQMIIALEAPSSSAVTALKKIGITTDELAAHMRKGLPDALQYIENQLENHGIKPGTAQYVGALREISGGTRQMQGMLNLMGPHLADFADKVKRVGAAASTTGNQVTGWALVQQNMNQQFDRFKTTLGAMMIELGQKLLPVATALFKFLADTALPAVKNLAEWLGDKLGGAAAGIAQGWKDLTSKGGLLYGVMQALPGILAGVHHYFDLLGRVWREQIQPTLIQILPTLKVLGIILGVVILGVLASVVVMFLLVVGVITVVVLAFLKLVQGIQFVITHFGDFLGAIGNFVGGVIGWFGNLQKGVEQKAHDLAANVTKKFMDLQQGLMKWGHDTAKNLIDTLTGLPGKFLDLGKNIMNALANGIKNAAGAVGSALKNVPGIGGIAGGLSSLIPKFAAQGGTFSEGEWGVVGEDNPEAIRVQNGRAIITPLSGGRLAASPAGMGSSSSGTAGGTLVVKLYVDGKQVTQAVLPHLTPAIRAIGNRRF